MHPSLLPFCFKIKGFFKVLPPALITEITKNLLNYTTFIDGTVDLKNYTETASKLVKLFIPLIPS